MGESTQLTQEQKKNDLRKNIITYICLAIGFIVIAALVPSNPDEYGPISLIPAIFLLVYIFWTKRILESLTLGSLLGFIMVHKADFLPAFNNMLIGVLMDEDIAWLIIVCGLMGSIIALIEKSGGAYAFGDFVATRAKKPRTALIWTFICSALICVDDYLNVLTTGSCMTPINDRFNIPREMDAYVVDSTAAPACVLNPISTWGVFIAGLAEANAVCGKGQGVATYIKSIPYNFYALAAIAMVLLVILGVVPIFGPMKGAWKRVEEGGPLAPPGSEKIDIRSGGEQDVEIPDNPKIYNFFIPIIVLIGSTILSGLDMQMGVIITVAFTFVFYVFQGMDPEEFADNVMRGLKNMLLPIVMVVLAFSFAAACREVKFIEYVIETATTFMTPQLLPFVVFLVFGMTEFIMGISWGMYVIALPIVIPITTAIGGDPIVTLGAVAAAGTWGSHCCFYSDATILTSASTGCDNFRHAITQIPYGLTAGVLAGIGYLILGFVAY